MNIRTKQNYRFTLLDGTTFNTVTTLLAVMNGDGSAAIQWVPDGVTADPYFAVAVADGSLAIVSEPMFSGIPSRETLGATTLTADANQVLSGIPTAEAFGATPL